MINFIKDAISSVEGIADFRFYDDYKFSEEQGQLSYPCAVLQPIPSMTFNRNRQITDKMGIVLSIFEVTPKDYDGDTLYALQKKCADLMLQVLANLDVKTKFSDDVQVATILPEGDELLCGAMISLELTMRQPRCIGAPSYIEIVVQPIKKESITSNGKHIITPSSGFNAMREVEVDVNVDLKGSLQDKSVTITENSTQTIVADEGFEGLNSVEVNSNVHGTGFSVLDGGEFQEEFNSLIAQKVTASNLASSQAEGDITWKFRNNADILYIISDKGVTGNQSLQGCTELRWLKLNIMSGGLKWALNFNNMILELDFTISRNTQVSGLLMNLTKAKKITINGRSDMLIFDMEGKIDISDFMRGSHAIKVPVIIPNGVTSTYLAFNSCSQIPYIDLGEVSEASFSNNAFSSCSSLATLKFTKWSKNSIPLNMTSVLTAESIHYIIQNAMSVADGATARTLTLHATAKTNWQNSEYYEQDLAVLTDKGITIA